MNAVVKFERSTDGYIVQYERAITGLQRCKEALSIEDLKPVDITIEALKARGKLLQDKRAKQAAWELEIEKAKTAAWIANEIVKRDKPTTRTGRHLTAVTPLSASGVLVRAGWTRCHASTAVAIARLRGAEIERLKRKPRIKNLQRAMTLGGLNGRGPGPSGVRAASAAYHSVMNVPAGANPFRSFMKANNIEKIAEQINDDERIKMRRALMEIRDWCANAVKVLK